MSLKKTLLLALVLVAALLYTFNFEIPREKERSEKDQVFKNIKPGNIEGIEIIKDGQAFSLVNTGSVHSAGDSGTDDRQAAEKWELADVKGAKLDAGALNGLISSLASLKLGEALPKEDIDGDLSVFGLKDPEIIIKVKQTRIQKELHLGKQNSYFGQRYAAFSGSDDIYLVPESIYTAASKGKNDFRDSTPLDYVDFDLRAIQLKSPGGDISFEVNADRKWEIVSPIKASASPAAMADLNRSFRGLKAAEFIDDTSDPAKYGLVPPSYSAHLQFLEDSKRAPLVLNIGTVKGEEETEQFYAYVDGGPSVYRLTLNPLPGIFKGPSDFREKNLFKFAPEQVNSVLIEGSFGPSISITKDAKIWKVNGKNGDQPFIAEYIKSLPSVQAAGFPADLSDYGFESPYAKITVELGGAGRDPRDVVKRTLVIGNLVDPEDPVKGNFAAADDLKEPFIISLPGVRKVVPGEETLVPQKPAEEQPESSADQEAAAPSAPEEVPAPGGSSIKLMPDAHEH